MTSPGKSETAGRGLAAVVPNSTLPWYRQRHLLKLNLCIALLVLFSSSNGYDGSLMNGLQALSVWQEFLETPSGAWLGFINALYWIGTGVTYPLAAWVANRWGRRPGVLLGYIALIVGVAVQAAAPNKAAFVVGRFFLGSASAWFGDAVPLLVSEIAYPTHRGSASALFNCGWYVGSVLAAWVTFGTRNYTDSWGWRIPSVLQALLPMLALPGLLLAPESPRYLVSKGRIDEARRVLADCHAEGDVDSPLIVYELDEIRTTLQREEEAAKSNDYVDMIRTRGNRHRLLISITLGIFSQWTGNGVVSYYLALVLSTVGVTSVTKQLIISACLQMWNLFFSVGAAFNVDRFGRRKLFLWSAAVMLCSYIIITGLSGSFAQTGNAATGVAVVPFLFVFFAGYDMALTPFLVSYPIEIWPFGLRSQGLAVTWCTAVVAVFFNTFINPIALEEIGWRYYLVFIFLLVCYGLTAYFFYPETRGHTLEDMAIVFDGENLLPHNGAGIEGLDAGANYSGRDTNAFSPRRDP